METNKMYSKTKRTEMIKSGAYDGRYKNRVIPNKKKKANKLWARKTK